MDLPPLPSEGGCRCGRVRLRMTKPPLVTAICHCRGCQRMTASAFSTTVTLPLDGLEVVAGETVVGGMHGGGAAGEHHHCEWCKSWLFTRLPPEYGAVNLRATMLDDARWFVPFIETQTAEALPWALAGAPHAFARFPEPADYPELMAAFARQ